MKRIHRQFGQTILFVTHDIHEAFRLADRIVLIHEGHIIQDGNPVDLVFHPKDEAVRTFLGKRGFSALLDQMVMDKLYARLQAGTLDVDLLVSQLKGETPSAF